uniref:Chymotrypsin MDP1C n=1 Tax=Mayetiola destructor TaxID=39758 RepID=Q5IS33_MAYDE|nr:chymotrypsin precursor MDP1C [Mayetiola destructor]
MNSVNTALLLVLLVGCALARSAVDIGRVIGGENAEKGQFPHQISMRNRFSNSHFCGGSIISKRFILTAAHCTQGQNANPKNVYAIVGALHRLSGGIKMALSEIIAHQEYNYRTIENDISLLQTVDDIVYSELVQPIALPTEIPPGALSVTISGWGRNSFPTPPGLSPLPDILQFAPAKTLSPEECESEFQATIYAHYLSETNVCTVNPKGRGACHGDSGGPLISNDKALVGIVSWGVPCAQGYPDVYTNVYLYLDWIHAEVAKLGDSVPSNITLE